PPPCVAAGQQSFAGFVAINHGTRPAAETAVATTGSAGVNLNSALAVRGAGVKLIEGAIASGVGFLEQVGPNLSGGEEFIRHPDAGQVRVPPQAVARWAGRHGLGAGGAFGAARSQVQNGLAPMSNPLLYQGVDRINLHPLRAQSEDAVGRRVT